VRRKFLSCRESKMGQTNGSDNGERRNERAFDLAVNRLNQRIDSVWADIAGAFGREQMRQSFEELSEMRVELMILDARVDLADQAVTRLEREFEMQVVQKARVSKQETMPRIAHHVSPPRRTRLGGLKLDEKIIDKIEEGKLLSTSDIGSIGEAIEFRPLKESSEASFAGDEWVTRQLGEHGIKSSDVEMRAFSGKTVHGHGPDYYFACRKMDKAVGIVEVKATTKATYLGRTLNDAVAGVQDFFKDKNITFVKRRYRVDFGEAEYGLAVAIYFDPKQLNNPEYQFSYRMKVVKRPHVNET